MAYIFYSETPCYLKIDGKYEGVVNKNPKILKELNDCCFLSFIPISKDFYSVETTLKDRVLLKVFKILDDFIILPIFDKKRNLSYKLILQKNFNLRNDFLIITVIQDGCYKFYLDGAVNFIDELPFLIKDIEIKEVQNKLLIIFYGLKTVIFAFNLESRKLIFKNFLTDFKISDLFITNTHYDILLPVNIIEKWDYNFKLIERDFENLKKPYDIHPKLLSVAFFELISLKANLSFLLSEDLKIREKDLLEFVGKPLAVFPYYKDISKTVVLLNDSAHLYSLSFQGGLITNILEE